MRSDVPFIAPETPLEEASQWALEHPAPAYLVGRPDELAGVVTRDQLEAGRTSGHARDPVLSVTETSFAHVHPDHPIDVVLERLSSSHGLLPVVSRAQVRCVEGVVTGEILLGRRTSS
jgi:CBS domain-containing protein